MTHQRFRAFQFDNPSAAGRAAEEPLAGYNWKRPQKDYVRWRLNPKPKPSTLNPKEDGLHPGRRPALDQPGGAWLCPVVPRHQRVEKVRP